MEKHYLFNGTLFNQSRNLEIASASFTKISLTVYLPFEVRSENSGEDTVVHLTNYVIKG